MVSGVRLGVSGVRFSKHTIFTMNPAYFLCVSVIRLGVSGIMLRVSGIRLGLSGVRFSGTQNIQNPKPEQYFLCTLCSFVCWKLVAGSCFFQLYNI